MRTIFILLLLASPLYAIDLTGHRVSNSGNRCTFACLETAGRAQGIPAMIGFINRHPGPGFMATIRKELAAVQVKNICEDDGVYNRETLTQHAATSGVTVTIIAGADFIDYQGCHSILVINYGEQEVKYFDPNHRYLYLYVSREKFDKFWSGNAIVVLPD